MYLSGAISNSASVCSVKYCIKYSVNVKVILKSLPRIFICFLQAHEHKDGAFVKSTQKSRSDNDNAEATSERG